ncbi:MAG: sulfatase-like hydrolase/transferase [Bacteroidales bacterium]|nr:sulfatase-like hydrolase/transferase [Candidatus Scybalocola fimicaballi]
MLSKGIYLSFFYVYFMMCFILERILFALFNFNNSFKDGIVEPIKSFAHGFPMDLSAAGYFMIPFLVAALVFSFWKNKKAEYNTYKVIGIVLSLMTAFFCVLDILLYPAWGFRLDATPFFYMQSPTAALASGTTSDYFIYGSTLVILASAFVFGFTRLLAKVNEFTKKDSILKFDGIGFNLIPTLLSVALVVLAIRGGVGVSTMNPGRVYFSDNVYFNHLALNLNWNLMYSIQKTDDFSEYYTMSDDEAQRIYEEKLAPSKLSPVYVDTFLNTKRPNILLCIMESFGGTACKLTGGEDAMPNLCKFAEDGIVFNRFYANSFRTDRGLACILASYPGMPTTSLMKVTNKSYKVKKLPNSLKEAGYKNSFYYGGDINFTNMNSFLVMSGYEKIICDANFSKDQKQSKWGAYDHVLFDYVANDFEKGEFEDGFFCTVLSSSSHEPFEVPYNHHEDKYLNSVMYSDSCLGSFLDRFRQTKYWDNTLIIILPDHSTALVGDLSNSDSLRYRIPMVWGGGAVRKHADVDKICSQIDLSATLLSQLDINHDDFMFSKDVFDNNFREFAIFAFNNGFGIIDKDGFASYDYDSQKEITSANAELLERGKSFIQTVYRDFERR